MLFINAEPVIDNDGEHGFRTRTGEIELEPGTHHIEVRYFENYGRAGLKLEWEGPGIDGRELVTAPEADSLQTVSGVPLAVDLQLDQSAFVGDDSLALTDLPTGTTVSAGGLWVTVNDSGVADITGWDTDTLSITPPVGFVGEVTANVSVTVHDASGHPATATHPLTFDVNEVNVTAPEATLVGGVKASYFDVDHSLRKIDDIDWDSAPTHEEIVQDINYENSRDSFWEGGSKDTFGAKLEGQITVEEGGDYTFFAGGDDGVVMYINGEAVIDNDGKHGFRTRSGKIELEPGTYDVEVRYFENYGKAGLKLEWDGPDTDGRELVTSDLNTHVEENGTVEVGLQLGTASDSATVSIDGLPPDTILHLGDASIVSDGGSVDLAGMDLSVLEIFPPPGFEGVIEGNITLTDEAFNGAEVMSHTPFTLEVGDSDSTSEVQWEDMDLMGSSEPAGQAWDAEADMSDAEARDDEVLSEPVVQHTSDDLGTANTDTYERFDW